MPSNESATLRRILATIALSGVVSGTFWTTLYFLAAGAYGFSPERNLALGVCMGAASALGARGASRVADILGPRRSVTIGLLLWSACGLGLWLLPHQEALLWIAAFIGAGCSSLVWSVAESYAAGKRQGAELARAVGSFALSWTPMTAVAQVLPAWAPQLGLGLEVCLPVAGTLALLAAVVASGLPASAGHGSSSAPPEHVEYRFLAQSALWLLPAGYVISSTLAPLLPARLAAVGLHTAAPAAAGIWLAVRFFTLYVLWRFAGWHGRWGQLLAAAVALLSGFTLVLLAQNAALLILGLASFGVGMGLVYYAALYYTLVSGAASVAAGGRFELVIGLAVVVGPALGLAARYVPGAGAPGVRTVYFTAAVLALLVPQVLRPYRAARRAALGADAARSK